MSELIAGLVVLVLLFVVLAYVAYQGKKAPAKKKDGCSSCDHHKKSCKEPCPTCYHPSDFKDERCERCGSGLPTQREPSE